MRTRLVVATVCLAALAASCQSRRPALVVEPCVLDGISARCGALVVPEHRGKPSGRKIEVHFVVLPAWSKPAEKDAVTYLAGGPGAAATEETTNLRQAWSALNAHHDILLVDQRGTGGSNAYSCPSRRKPISSNSALRAYTQACLEAFGGDVTQYGTRMAMDDLDAVRAALGYTQLDVVGSSYGATAAQVYLKLHPASVRTLTFVAGTALDVPFFSRYAVNAERALHQWAKLCAAQPFCRKAVPNWERRFGETVNAWDTHPAQTRERTTMTGVQFASIIHRMLLDLDGAPSIPLVVSRAAEGDFAPLNRAGGGDLGVSPQLMYWSTWCNEPWTGLDAKGPWGSAFDSYTAAFIAQIRRGCTFIPRRPEPRSLWTFPSSTRVPVLAIAGGADPQDPITNLPDLKRSFADSQVVVLPRVGHNFGLGYCIDDILTDFVTRATTKRLVTTRCESSIVVAPFELSD
jgi:pimeloyl-ACP methyl ester carboxylesterase